MMDVFQFKDLKTVQDPIHPYPDSVKHSEIPLIIDNGSYQCRAGWMTDCHPILKFKSVIAKPRKERSKKDGEVSTTPQTLVGNDIVNLEAMRFQLKTQFDRNVVTHFEAQEHIFDYMFTHLGIDYEGSVPHPIVMTEPFLNPNYSRQLMSELLFECYGIPGIAYGVDALYGYFYAQNKPKENALLVNIGYHNIHVIPILDGNVAFQHSRRINTGGYHVIMFLHRLLQLKYPVHSAAITLGRVEELIHEHCEIAVNYQDELEKWSCPTYYENHIRKIQLPYTVVVPVSGLTLEQQKERKKELAKRLMEMNARKREERLAEDEEKLNHLLAIQDLYEEGEEEEFTRSLATNGIKSAEELQKMIGILNAKIEKTKQKMLAANQCEEPVIEDKVKSIKMDQVPQEEMQTFLINLKRKRQDLLKKRAARKQRRNDMAKRRTAAAQERMRIISQLAKKEKGNDDFGLRDEDWDVYKTISREGGDSDSEVENEKLMEVEELLRQHEPSAIASTPSEPGEAHQLHIGVERFRAVELLFQPSMTGSIEAGLSETVAYVLKLLPADQQELLAKNVVLMGSLASLPGLQPRLERELQECRPFKSSIRVSIMNDPGLCGWRGARKWATQINLSDYLFTRAEYLEQGADYMKPHRASNPFCPTPGTQPGAPADIVD